MTVKKTIQKELQHQMVLAMLSNDLEEIQKCLEAGADVNHQLTDKELVIEQHGTHYALGVKGESWLARACRASNKQDVVDLLLHYGANPNQIDPHFRDGDSILMDLMGYRDKERLIESLVRAGADVFYQNEKGTSVLDESIYYGEVGYVNIIERIYPYFMAESLKRTRGEAFLILDVIQNLEYDFLDKIEREFPEYGEHINQCDLKGETALISHAKYSKANWNYVDPSVRDSYEKVLEQLLKMGADPFIKNKEGVSAKAILMESKIERLLHLIEWHELSVTVPQTKEELAGEQKNLYVKRL